MSSDHPPEVHHLAPTQPNLSLSPALSAISGTEGSMASPDLYRESNQHRPSLHQRSYSSPHVDHDRFPGWQPVASPYSSRQQTTHRPPSTVDVGRLNDIYNQHANDFWSAIAAKYSGGTNLTPYQLEQAFLQNQNVEEPSPEIPRITISRPSITAMASQDTSPDLKPPRTSSHIRSSSVSSSIAERCSVESLLNHSRP